MIKKKNFIFMLTIAMCLSQINTKGQSALTIDSALQSAYKQHPMMQQGKFLLLQQQAMLKSTSAFDPLNISGTYGQINSGLYDFDIGVSQTIKLPGAIKAEKNVLNENIQVARLAVEITKSEITKNVMAAYYNWIYAWQYYKLLDSLNTTYRDFEIFANKKFNTGETGILEKTNAQAQSADLQLQKKQALADIYIYESELQQWMANEGKLIPPKTLERLPMPLMNDSLRLTKNPLLEYSLQQNKLNTALLQMEKARSIPTISLGISTQSIDHVSSFNIFHAGINIPLFNAGVRARVQAANYGIQAAGKETEKTKRQLAASFYQLFQQVEKANEQLAYYQKDGLQYAETIIQAAKKSYQAGNIGYMEFVQNLKEATNLKVGYLQSLNAYNQAIIQLNYLINKEF